MAGKRVKAYPHLTLFPNEVEWGEWDIRNQNGEIVDPDKLPSTWDYDTDLELSISVKVQLEGIRRVLGDEESLPRLICEVQCRPTHWSVIEESRDVQLDSESFVAVVSAKIPGRKVAGELKLRVALVAGALNIDGYNTDETAYIAVQEDSLSLNAKGAGMPFSQLDFSRVREWDKNAPWVVRCNASNPEALYSRCVRVFVNTKHPVCKVLVRGEEKDYEILEPAISRDFLATLVREIYVAHLNETSLYASQKELTEGNCEEFQIVTQRIIKENFSMTIPELIDALKRDWNSVQSKIDGITGYMQKGWK